MIGCPTIADGKTGPPGKRHPLTYIGVDAQYFSAVMIPTMEKPDDVWFSASQPIRVGKVDPHHTNLTNTSFRLISLLKNNLKPGEELSHNFEIFAGPKRPPLLSNYGLGELVYYGWPIYRGPGHAADVDFARFLLCSWNYGLAIILLTVLVRGCMFPLSRKQAQRRRRCRSCSRRSRRSRRSTRTTWRAAPRPSRSCSASTTTIR